MKEFPTFFTPNGAWPEVVLRRSDDSRVTVTAAQLEALIGAVGNARDFLLVLADDLSCDAGNWDGGSADACEHCRLMGMLRALDAALAPLEARL